MTGTEIGLGVRALEWIVARLGWWIPQLEFVFDPSDARYVQTTFILRDRIAHGQSGIAVATIAVRASLLRVGLRTRGHKSVDDVRVELARLQPPVVATVPFPLKVAHNQSEPLTLHPSRHPAQFVEIAVKADGNDEPVTVQHHVQPIDISLGPGEYQFTLVATGRDVSAVERTFILSIDLHGQPRFRATG